MQREEVQVIDFHSWPHEDPGGPALVEGDGGLMEEKKGNEEEG